VKMVVGIAGGTAGGKSTFCEKLKKALDGYRVQMLHMDFYFKDVKDMPCVPSHINGRHYTDYNCPDTVDWDRYHADLQAAIESDAQVVIAEGLLVLWDRETADKLDMKIFVDCRADERIVRRIRRNQQWGLTFDEITDVYLNMVRFRHDQYVEPAKWTADVIVNGAGDTDMVCEMCASHIRSKL